MTVPVLCHNKWKGEGGGIICWHHYQKWKNCSCYTFFWCNYPSIRFFDDRDNRTEQLHDPCNRTRHAEIAPSLNDFIENLLTSILSPILNASAILRMALQCPFKLITDVWILHKHDSCDRSKFHILSRLLIWNSFTNALQLENISSAPNAKLTLEI